jgi:hypothetical protein
LLDLFEQAVPGAGQGAAQADEDRQRRSELSGFELLEIPGRDLGFLRELLLRQPRSCARAPEVAAQYVDLLLRSPLHRKPPMLPAPPHRRE